MIDKEFNKLIQKTNIQNELLKLAADNKAISYKALKALSSFYSMTKRKDALIAIIGFIYYKIKNTDDVMDIFNSIKMLNNYEISAHLFKIISKDKEIHKKRLFIDNFARYISTHKYLTYTEIEANGIKEIINDSNWGPRSKKKFLKIFKDYEDEFSYF